MDDGNLGDSVDQNGGAIDDQLHEPINHRFSNDNAHLSPSRWWFASSAFPMIAGTLGPTASAFSICALVRPWRQLYVPGSNPQDAIYTEDPTWLIVINAIQLAIAIIANIFLLLNMAQRVRFIIAQPITMIGWFFSALTLMCLECTAAGPLKEGLNDDGFIWSQAFWYGIWAAILYFVVASLMVITFWGAMAGHYPKDFELTPSQRTLMLQTIMFLVYLLIGALIFSNIEGWGYLDAVYWANVTLFTIGFGDYSPQTVLGRALVMPYALVGIISLGLVIGSIRSMVLERGRRRLDARMEEKTRRRVIRSMTTHGRDNILKPINTVSDLSPDSPEPITDDLPATEYERRKVEFEIMREIQRRTYNRRRWVAVSISGSIWVLLWLLGAYIFMKAERPYQHFWNYFQSFYFCFCALTTIGYGDLTPISNCGKSFFVFWSLLALPTMTILISNAGDTIVRIIKEGTIQLGNITILPGEMSFIKSLKHVISVLTCSQLFPEHRDVAPPPYVEHLRRASEDNIPAISEPDHQEQMNRSRLGQHEQGARGVSHARPSRSRRAMSTFTAQVRRSLSRIRDPLEELPSGTDFFFLLVSEIQVVSNHLRESEPHKYSYEDWAWYLRLIGEDERSPETHRKAVPHISKKKKRKSTDGLKPEDEDKWSWVGNKSPLMGSVEESQWILDSLTERLKVLVSEEGRKAKREAASMFKHGSSLAVPGSNHNLDEKHDRLSA